VSEVHLVAVDVARVERHRLRPARHRNPGVGVAEQQQRVARGVGQVGRLDVVGRHVHVPDGAARSKGRRVVPAVELRLPADEAVPAHLVVLQLADIGVDSVRGRAPPQLDERLHRSSPHP
jgi:hypothetical protein